MGQLAADTFDIIGDLHEGVADPECWTRGLDRLSAMFGNSVIMFGTFGIDRKVFNLSGHGIPRKMLEALAGPLADVEANPWIPAGWSAPLRRLITIDDIGADRMRQSRVWADVNVAGGIPDAVGTVLERWQDRAEFVLFGATTTTTYSPAMHAQITELIPHLARAWRVHRAVAAWQQRASDMAAALDRLDRGVIVTGADGRVRYANRSAERLLGSGRGLDATRGRLRAARSADTSALTAIIDGATRTGIGKGNAAVDALALPRGDDTSPLAVVAEPLSPAHADRLGQTQEHGAILFVSEAESASRPPPARLAAVYGLTPAEAQVAAYLASGEGVPAAAAELGITVNTAKTHLKAVFEKVGVTRQAQLVRRIVADVGGLANDSLHGAGG